MRNIQLSSISVTLAVLQRSLFGHLHYGSKPALYGFNLWVWVLVLIRSVTGIVVAAVIKTSDNVVKGIASGVSVIVGCILSMILFGTPLTLQFVFGASLVIPASFFFSNEGTLEKIVRLVFQVPRFTLKYSLLGTTILMLVFQARSFRIFTHTTLSAETNQNKSE